MRADWIVGGQLNTSTDDSRPNDCTDYSWVPTKISWTATDAGSGTGDYNMWDVTSAAAPHFLGWWSEAGDGDFDNPSFDGSFSDYDGDCGGGSLETDAYAVTAYDTVGNATYKEVALFPTVVQENGRSATFGSNGVTIAFSGAWQTSTCACASWGRATFTTQLGATAAINVPSGISRVGLVMAKGPSRGQADVLVDGARVSTIDTRAAANTNRIIVWTRELSAGAHVVRVKNLATVGRPRIDLDALLLGG